MGFSRQPYPGEIWYSPEPPPERGFDVARFVWNVFLIVAVVAVVAMCADFAGVISIKAIAHKVAPGILADDEPTPAPDAEPESGAWSPYAPHAAETCPACTQPAAVSEVGYIGQFVDRLSEITRTPAELRDILARVYVESRWNPAAVSKRGAWGPCGIRLSAWPDVDGPRLTVDPAYAAEQCYRVYREYADDCPFDWECCYLRGRAGCIKFMGL